MFEEMIYLWVFLWWLSGFLAIWWLSRDSDCPTWGQFTMWIICAWLGLALSLIVAFCILVQAEFWNEPICFWRKKEKYQSRDGVN